MNASNAQYHKESIKMARHTCPGYEAFSVLQLVSFLAFGGCGGTASPPTAMSDSSGINAQGKAETQWPKTQVFWQRSDAGTCDPGADAAPGWCAICLARPMGNCHEQCTLGVGDACYLEGLLLNSTSHFAAGADSNERACALRSYRGCTSYAGALMDGRGHRKDVAAARKLYEDMCGIGDGFACAQLAVELLAGENIPQNLTLGETILSRGCELKDEFACLLKNDSRRFTDLDRAVRTAKWTAFANGPSTVDGGLSTPESPDASVERQR